ncbi:NapC/NirT family cytochrome c, partial [Oleiphilus sp. HI0132]
MSAANFVKGLMARKILFGATVTAALFFMLVGVIFWGGFNTAMEQTNTLEFCISCHEMEDNVYKEYQSTIHYTNRSGVRASCSDCHVPDPWVHKVVRKIKASNELWHKA